MIAEADWPTACLCNYGLSKVMCDLSCVQNADCADTTLMQTLQALLNYQTEYIVYASGDVITTAAAPGDRGPRCHTAGQHFCCRSYNK